MNLLDLAQEQGREFKAIVNILILGSIPLSAVQSQLNKYQNIICYAEHGIIEISYRKIRLVIEKTLDGNQPIYIIREIIRSLK